MFPAVMFLPLPVQAQSQSSVSPQATGPYSDRLIENGGLAQEMALASGVNTNQTGAPRSLLVELNGLWTAPALTVAGAAVPGASEGQRQTGMRLQGRYQTENYGLVGIDVALSHVSSRGAAWSPAGTQGTRASFTLSDKNVPIRDGWVVDGELGLVTSTQTDVARRQSRFYLPIQPLEGASLVLRKLDSSSDIPDHGHSNPTTSLNLSVGTPGFLNGLVSPGFSSLGGIEATAGGTLPLSAHWIGGIQALMVSNSRDPYVSTASTPSRVQAQAMFASLGYVAGPLEVRSNVLWSHFAAQNVATSPMRAGSGLGTWLDASLRAKNQLHTAGLYYLAPHLSWGTNAIASNAYGLYYRYNLSSQRWHWLVSVDAAGSADGASPSGVVASTNLRHQLTLSLGVGANATLRVTNGATAGQLTTYADYKSRLGTTRAEAAWSRDAASHLLHLSVNQDWKLPARFSQGTRLATQFTLDRLWQGSGMNAASTTGSRHSNSVGFALNGATPLTSNIDLSATLAWNSNAGSSVYGPYLGPVDPSMVLAAQRTQAWSATLAATARLSSRFSLVASFTDTRTNQLAVNSTLTPSTSPLGPFADKTTTHQVSTQRLVSGYLTLRYSFAAGSEARLNGQRSYPGPGSGTVVGIVFLDANDNQQHDPGETGVQGVEIILDALQAVRTDKDGVYRFDNVAQGHHRIDIIADALPLPWSIHSATDRKGRSDASVEIEVHPRETTTRNIPASR